MLSLWLLFIAGGYVTGSIPVGVLIGRAKGIDISQHGSRNVGATNVGRVLGRRLGLLCFFLDAAKGAGPVIAAGVWAGIYGRPAEPSSLTPVEMWLWMGVAAAAVAGHMASVFLRFRGGKGVATSFGALLALWPLLTLPALGALVVWAAALAAWRMVSLASLLAAASLPVLYVLRVRPESVEVFRATSPPVVVTAALALLVVWAHRANIGRLRRGEEPKIGAKRG